jgi:hypothetical protein
MSVWDAAMNIPGYVLKEMKEMLAPVVIPNPDIYPQSFLYYYRLYRLEKDK